MRGAAGGPRLLLRRLREVVREPIEPQARLDKIVVLVASNMVAEVCSVYVQRADGTLELFATEGLKREAVHLTTMRAGEGLVGLIATTAEPLALADAQANPAFSYKPETGEEIFHSFLGVPILRGGDTLGVLVVQNRARREYAEEEVEALETVSLLLGEMIASGGLKALAGPGPGLAIKRPLALKGAAIAEGIGLGHVVLHQPRVAVVNLVADDPAAETVRLDSAIVEVRRTIDRLIDESENAGPGEHRDVLEAFRLVANDRGWLRRLREAVAGGLTAEAAVERVQNEARARLMRQTDPYLRERLHDLEDLANRVMLQLAGRSAVREPSQLPDNAILVARSMGPAAILEYDRARLRGLVLEDGGMTSHVAIVARALGIPVVGDVANVVALAEDGDAIIVDGGAGEAFLRPGPEVEAAYAEKARLRARRLEQYSGLRDVASVTRDGVEMRLHMNAGLVVDMAHLEETGAASVGLFRTELQFMLAQRFPRVDAQRALYASVLAAAGGRTVTFRTLDIGGDKVLPYMPRIEEPNPALGWRAIRMGLDRPALLRSQLRALILAAGERPLRVMFPMVATLAEFDAARGLATRELDHSRRHGRPAPAVAFGAMIEIPALLGVLDELLAKADFVSVGSNDLVQYLFAADRDNKRVGRRYDSLSRPALRALREIARAGARAGKPATLCGEMGGRPLEAMALAAIGYRDLSMTPSAIGPVKAMLLTLDLGAAERRVAELLDGPGGPEELRAPLAEFAAGAGLAL